MKTPDYQGDVVWIIGASSGIGAALARRLSAAGAKLVLSARRAEALKDLNQELGGGHLVKPVDVTDSTATALVAQEIKADLGRLDRVVLLAAVYDPGPLHTMDMQAAEMMVKVNLFGSLSVIHAVMPILRAQDHGQIALCASVAGFMGLPMGQPYAATKAGMINLVESLRVETPSSIDVKVINPGFVDTDMTAKNDFPMPMMITADKAAEHIAKGLTSRAYEIHFPKGFTVALKLIRTLPGPLRRQLLKLVMPSA